MLLGEITIAMPLLLPGDIVPSNLPEMLMCILQMRPWFHDTLIPSKLGLPQSLHPQLLPFPVPARMLLWSHTELVQKRQNQLKNKIITLPCQFSSLRSQTSTSAGARDGVGMHMMQSQAATALVWISLNRLGTALQAGLANACYLNCLC